MTPEAERVLADALRMPEDVRGDIAARLIESLGPKADAGEAADWDEEIRRRVEELDSGAVRPVPWPEARRQILEDGDDAPGP